MFKTDGAVRWEDIDQRLISPKLTEIAADMQQRASEEERRISSDVQRSGNRAGYLPRLFDFQQQLTNEWAAMVFDAYCKTWEEQNRSISGQFIRLIRDRAVLPMIATRKGTVEEIVTLRASRIGDSASVSVLGEWSRRMSGLANRWTRDLEAKAVACEYRLARPASDAARPNAQENDTEVPASSHHLLSLVECEVCRHYECYHDEQGCFLDPNGKRS